MTTSRPCRTVFLMRLRKGLLGLGLLELSRTRLFHLGWWLMTSWQVLALLWTRVNVVPWKCVWHRNSAAEVVDGFWLKTSLNVPVRRGLLRARGRGPMGTTRRPVL